MARLHSKRGAMADINVVPYVDVMLVLLVIFMVTAPLVTPGVIDLPSVGKASQPRTAPLEVVIKEDKSLSVRERDSAGRIVSDLSSLITTSSGATLDGLVLPTDGRSITPGVTSGAVTMKMTSSTSITSTYGTTLISLIAPRLECSLATIVAPSAAAGCSRTLP